MVAFAHVKEKVSLTDTVKLLGLSMVEKDGQLRGPCPSCNAGGTRALVVTPHKGAFCWHMKKGGDQLWLVAHTKGMQLKEAAEWLDKGGTATGPRTALPEGSMKPLDHLHPRHDRVQAIIEEETAIAMGVGFASKGVMRGCVAVPLHDQQGLLVGYVGIEEDGSYRFPDRFLHNLFIFNAHQVMGREVQIAPTVSDALRAMEQGIMDVVCFLTLTVSDAQLKQLANWLHDHDRVAVI